MTKSNVKSNLRTLLWIALGALMAGCGSPAPISATSPFATPTTLLASATFAPTATSIPLADGTFLEKTDANEIRVVSYNVNWDSIFPSEDANNDDLRSFNRATSFQRMMRALLPDILCLQEINPQRDPDDVAMFLDGIVDVDGNQNWQAVIARDMLIATHFDLKPDGFEMKASSGIPGLNQAAALIELPEQYGGGGFYAICAHFKSGSEISDERMRQRQADALMNHLRDATSLGGGFDLPAGTPFVILGDFNIYDVESNRLLTTMLTGDIDNEAVYGNDFLPDWDQTVLAEVAPSHNALGIDFYTWRDDGEPFVPGVLDHILFSDSLLKPVRSFILDSLQITDAGLDSLGLQKTDVLLETDPLNFDHLPLVVDLVLVNN